MTIDTLVCLAADYPGIVEELVFEGYEAEYPIAECRDGIVRVTEEN